MAGADMLNWLRDFWYQDLPDEMQSRMLRRVWRRRLRTRYYIPSRSLKLSRQHG